MKPSTICLIVWLVIILLGPEFKSYISEQYMYLYGFTIGTFSMAVLDLKIAFERKGM